MNEPSDHETAKVEHPDLDGAVYGDDDHGPIFPATLDGLEDTDDYQISEGDGGGEEDHHA